MRVEIEQKEQIPRSFDSVCVRVSYMGKDVYNSDTCIEHLRNHQTSLVSKTYLKTNVIK